MVIEVFVSPFWGCSNVLLTVSLSKFQLTFSECIARESTPSIVVRYKIVHMYLHTYLHPTRVNNIRRHCRPSRDERQRKKTTRRKAETNLKEQI